MTGPAPRATNRAARAAGLLGCKPFGGNKKNKKDRLTSNGLLDGEVRE
jgi:hypothetical protein